MIKMDDYNLLSQTKLKFFEIKTGGLRSRVVEQDEDYVVGFGIRLG